MATPLANSATLSTPPFQKFPMPPDPSSEEIRNADFLKKMVDELGLTNAPDLNVDNLPDLNLGSMLDIPPPLPNPSDSLYLNDQMDDTWWSSPPSSTTPSSVSRAMISCPWPSESSSRPPASSSETIPATRKRSKSKENKPPGNVNAPRLPNGRYRPLKESPPVVVPSVLASSLAAPVTSLPLATSEALLPPVTASAVETPPTMKVVIKTPLYNNFAPFAHAIHSPIVSTSESGTTYSSFVNDQFSFPTPDRIASDIIEMIIQNSNRLRLSFVKISFLSSSLRSFPKLL